MGEITSSKKVEELLRQEREEREREEREREERESRDSVREREREKVR